LRKSWVVYSSFPVLISRTQFASLATATLHTMGQPIGPWYRSSAQRKRARAGTAGTLADDAVVDDYASHPVAVAVRSFGDSGAFHGAERVTDVEADAHPRLLARVDGLDRDVVSDVAAFYTALPAGEGLRRGCLDIVRARRDRPSFLLQRRAAAAMFYDSEEDESEGEERADEDEEADGSGNGSIEGSHVRMDGTARDGLAMVYVDTVDGVCWELGCWPDLQEPVGPDIFQIVLDVLTETVGTCSIATLRVHENLHSLQGVVDGLNMLRHMSIPPLGGHVMHQHGVSSFLHPITGERIAIRAAL
jgi:hypothetical protein